MKTALKTFVCGLIGLSLPVHSVAQVHETTPSSSIREVTVFTKAAQISRTAQVNLKPGYNRVLLKKLSPFINVNSIRVSGFKGITIVSVNHTINYLADEVDDPIFDQLVDERDDLIFEREKYKIKQTNLSREKNLIFKNKSIKSQKNGLIVEDLMDMSEFYAERLTEINRLLISNQSRIKDFTDKINRINKQLKERRSSNNKSRGNIEVTIKSESATSGQISCNYIVRNAGWYPIYDLRVKELNTDIDFTYKSMVYQKTGIDWKNVTLKLSTGDPEKSSTAPELYPWRLYAQNNYYKQQQYNSYYQQNAVQLKQQQNVSFEREPYFNFRTEQDNIIGDTAYNLSSSSVTSVFNEFQSTQKNINQLSYNWNQDAYGNIVNAPAELDPYGNPKLINESNASYATITRDELAKMPSRSAQSIASYSISKKSKRRRNKNTTGDNTQISQTSVNTTFEIDAPYSIPSNGKKYNVEIQSYDVPAIYEYYCAPKQSTNTYLIAKAADWDELNILPGNSSVYFQGTFVGESVIDPNVTEDTLELSLGRDQNIVVNRKLLKEFSRKVSIGSNKKVERAYEISVKNTRNKAITLLMVDQIPVSGNKDVEIELLEKSGASLDEETGKLSWKLNLEPGESKTLTFKFEIKHPKNISISNL